MASRKEYVYQIKGKKIAILERDVISSDGLNYSFAGTSGDGLIHGTSSGSTAWKSPISTVADGLEIEYVYSPKYFINETDDVSASIGNYMSDGGNLVITSNTVTLSAFADGTDEDTTDVTVTSADHGFSNGDSIIVTGTTNYNGTYTIDQVTSNTFDIEVAFNAGEIIGSATTLGTLNVNYGNLGGYNIADGSYIVLRGAGKFNGLHKTITKDAHNGGTNNKIKLETKYSGSTSLLSMDSIASLYYNIDILNDENDEIDLPIYLTKALVLYVKAKIAEDSMNIEAKEYLMKEFRKMLEKHESGKIWGARQLMPGTGAIR